MGSMWSNRKIRASRAVYARTQQLVVHINDSAQLQVLFHESETLLPRPGHLDPRPGGIVDLGGTGEMKGRTKISCSPCSPCHTSSIVYNLSHASVSKEYPLQALLKPHLFVIGYVRARRSSSEELPHGVDEPGNGFCTSEFPLCKCYIEIIRHSRSKIGQEWPLLDQKMLFYQDVPILDFNAFVNDHIMHCVLLRSSMFCGGSSIPIVWISVWSKSATASLRELRKLLTFNSCCFKSFPLAQK